MCLDYWDTYWIVRGLMISNMMQTAKTVIDNLLDMVVKFGFVPNATQMLHVIIPMLVLVIICGINNCHWLIPLVLLR